MRGLRILIIDNSIFFQDTCTRELAQRLPAGSLLEKAGDPVEARNKIGLFRPNLILLNFSLAVITVDGNMFLPLLVSRHPKLPIISYGLLPGSRNTALNMGAAEYLPKPGPEKNISAFFDQLAKLICSCPPERDAASGQEQMVGPGAIVTREVWHAAMVPPAAPRSPGAAPEPKTFPTPRPDTRIIAIGSSTGGTEALSAILTQLRPPLPGIVVVQHIPPMFSRLLSQRLNEECVLTIKEGASGDEVQPDHVYIAPGNHHMTVRCHEGRIYLDCRPGPPVHSCCPSVDVLFDSIASQIGARALGVILTGMGRDGAAGLLHMRQQGALALGQDQATSVVYGMPKAAFDLGAVMQQVPLPGLAGAISRLVR